MRAARCIEGTTVLPPSPSLPPLPLFEPISSRSAPLRERVRVSVQQSFEPQSSGPTITPRLSCIEREPLDPIVSISKHRASRVEPSRFQWRTLCARARTPLERFDDSPRSGRPAAFPLSSMPRARLARARSQSHLRGGGARGNIRSWTLARRSGRLRTISGKTSAPRYRPSKRARTERTGFFNKGTAGRG